MPRILTSTTVAMIDTATRLLFAGWPRSYARVAVLGEAARREGVNPDARRSRVGPAQTLTRARYRQGCRPHAGLCNRCCGRRRWSFRGPGFGGVRRADFGLVIRRTRGLGSALPREPTYALGSSSAPLRQARVAGTRGGAVMAASAAILHSSCLRAARRWQTQATDVDPIDTSCSDRDRSLNDVEWFLKTFISHRNSVTSTKAQRSRLRSMKEKYLRNANTLPTPAGTMAQRSTLKR